MTLIVKKEFGIWYKQQRLHILAGEQLEVCGYKRCGQRYEHIELLWRRGNYLPLVIRFNEDAYREYINDPYVERDPVKKAVAKVRERNPQYGKEDI